MKIAIIPGDGIGKEVLPAALSVLDAFGLDIEKVPLEIGFGKWEKTGSAITDDDIRSHQAVRLRSVRSYYNSYLIPIIRVFLCECAKNLTCMQISVHSHL